MSSCPKLQSSDSLSQSGRLDINAHSYGQLGKASGESTPLLEHEADGSAPHWPRIRELGWLTPYGSKYPPPTLPNSLRGLQADLDSAWMELERQHVIVNRINLLSSSLAILITSSGGITTAMAGRKAGTIWSTAMGTLTTLAGTVMGGLRASGQPRRAEDRVRRLERIIDHIGRLYYTVDDDAQKAKVAVEETWKMIDEEETRTEREERRSSSPFNNVIGGFAGAGRYALEGGEENTLNALLRRDATRPALPRRSTSKLLGTDRSYRPRMHSVPL